MADVWLSSGHRLLHRAEDGRLQPSDDFWRAYLHRAELAPIETSCRQERELHAALLARPLQTIDEGQLGRIEDGDARENYRYFFAFRDRLLAHRGLEAAYLDMVTHGSIGIPPLFLDHLVHVFSHQILLECDDPLLFRAAELLFREQRVTLQDHRVMLADDEIVAMHASGRSFGHLGRLLAANATPQRQIELDVLDRDNAQIYWERSDRFDTVLDLGFTRPGLDAFCRVLERWVRHFLDLKVQVQPVQKISDERWAWHIGLDLEASALLNDLYDGDEVEKDRLGRLLSLFRLDFEQPDMVLERLRGRPAYLGLMMTENGRLKVKPQNILVNLPLADRA